MKSEEITIHKEYIYNKMQFTFPGLKSAKLAKASLEPVLLLLPPELEKGSLPPKGSEPNPAKGSTLGLAGDAVRGDDLKGVGLFDLGGGGLEGGAFFVLGGWLGRLGDFLPEGILEAVEVELLKGSRPEVDEIWKRKMKIYMYMT